MNRPKKEPILQIVGYRDKSSGMTQQSVPRELGERVAKVVARVLSKYVSQKTD